jgi:alanine racemase
VRAPEGSIEARLAAAGLPPLPRMAWLELDLGALFGNLATLRALGGGAPVHPVVKGDAYGHGAIPIARALAEAGADGLSVATMDEALELREAELTLPIRVLYPIPPELTGEAMRHAITVAIGDGSTAGALLAAAERRDGPEPLLVEIEVETGLARGGAPPAEIVALVERIEASPATRLTGIWTHLQASEDGARTGGQLRRFDEASDALAASGRTLPRRHVAASGGILKGVGGFDGVRPGLSIYGIFPDAIDPALVSVGEAPGLRPVMSLHARPVRVADLPAGHGISYGPTFTTARPSRIASLPLGYGDGYARANANRARALVRGRPVPLVGNVTMDAVMADVTDVPGPPVTLDDEFVLLGTQGDERIPVEELAQLRTTNTWEVIASMSGRLPRVYHAATGAVVGLRTLTRWRG